MAAKIANVQEVAPELLVFYDRNAKIHSPEQVEALKGSIREFGFLTPCLIDKDMNLIAGHGRVMAAKELGMHTVPCVLIEGLSEEQRRAYIMADNRLAEMAEWNMDLVAEELADLELSGFDIDLIGFDRDEIAEQLPEIDPADFSFEDEPEEPTTQRGQIWRLGDHILMCGDSTSAEDVRRLVGDREVDLFLTDPPYNVDYDGGSKLRDEIKNDSMDNGEFYQFLVAAFRNGASALKPGGAFYIWHAHKTQGVFERALQDAELVPSQQLIWVKSHASFTRSDYQWMHEPCFYGWKEGAAHFFYNSRKETTVYEDEGVRLSNLKKQELIDLCEALMGLRQETTVARFERPFTSADHPTMKPVELIAWQMRNSSRKGETVLDLFGGSGSTLIAAEQLGRKCLMMELDPGYCDVIIQRWEKLTGREAELINGD